MQNTRMRQWKISAFIRLSFVLFVILHLWAGTLLAQTIALFPLLDLSKDLNGINSGLSERVYLELLLRGKKLVPPDEVMNFMVRNRIRTLGQLTGYQISLVGKELAAELLLQGTVCQLNDGEKPVLSLNLQLSRTSDGQVVWARTENLCYFDSINLLAIDEPRSLEDLYKPFFSHFFAHLPEGIGGQVKAPDTLNIARVLIRPTYLRAGEKVSCRIKLRTLPADKAGTPKLFIQVRSKEYPLVTDEENTFLEASWQAEQEGGSYPVTLVARWPTEAVQKKVIGTYTVDVQSPGAELHLIGVERDGKIMFSDKLVIIPKLLEPEPTTRWEITVFDEDNEAVVVMGDSGNIPLRLTWRGKTSLGNMANPGDYIIQFKVWDRAERESSTEASVRYLPEPPDIFLEVNRKEDQVLVDLDNMVETPLNYWWAKFYEENGRLLKLVQGTELPVTVELGHIDDPKEKIQCLLAARDILGNQSELSIPNLFQQGEGDAEEAESSIETEWVEEF